MAFVSDSCPDIVVDEPGLHDVLQSYGYDPENKAASASIMEQARGYYASYLIFDDEGQKRKLCSATWRNFGPAGLKTHHLFKHSD